jgi:hypothetical protein
MLQIRYKRFLQRKENIFFCVITKLFLLNLEFETNDLVSARKTFGWKYEIFLSKLLKINHFDQ